ncbi:flavin-dependent monooxygenase [Chamberlinius hualienensis]
MFKNITLNHSNAVKQHSDLDYNILGRIDWTESEVILLALNFMFLKFRKYFSIIQNLWFVIGAGASGLTAIKACLEEGLPVLCYERTDDIGGLWRYKEFNDEGVGSVMKSTIINTSKEMTAFSDFPPPEDLPNFMHNKQIFQYLQSYAQHFNLNEHVKLGHQVLRVEKDDKFEENGQWKVTVANQKTNERSVVEASAVFVCSGHHSFPYLPAFKGLENFRGTVTHSHAYKDPKRFENRRVLVVGIGNSGGDIAVELSHVAGKVYLATRRGAWVLPRLGDHGEPIDIQYGRRYIVEILNWLPMWLKNLHAEYKLNTRYNHEMYNLKPDHHFYSQHPMVNDELPGKLLSGAITLKGPIDHFGDHEVVFEGESHTGYPIDDVILATGYSIRFPFLAEDLAKVNENQVCLYKYVFPPQISHPTLAFIGLIQPFGPVPPICEMQARWVAQVLCGLKRIPTKEKMEDDILITRRKHQQRYVNSRRHTIEVDSIPYLDEIASLAGVKPNFKSMLTDFNLLYACVFGPSVPYQYRLHGPHSWTSAREVILQTPRRVLKPFNTRLPINESQLKPKSELSKLIANLIVVGVTIFLWFFSCFYLF